MSCSLRCAFVVLVVLLAGLGGAYAQAPGASISGVVKDSAGGVVPGVTVIVKEDATGRQHEVVTDADGRYSVPALLAGSYTVTASLTGFRTAEAKGVRVAPGLPVTIPLTLEVGSLSEVIIVKSSAELINTQTATVASTLNVDQLLRMPTPTRNALNAVTFLPGVNTPGANRDSTINGLPEGFYSITLDGVSNNDNFLRNTDGFFASITPRQDAVEAVTVTLAAAGASIGGSASGAVNMAFQTRSGGNRFTGSAYEYWRDPSLNSNYYFNEINNQPKNQVGLNQYGVRAGGPVLIPRLYDGRNKTFFFFHYEQIRFPNSFTRTRTIYNSAVQDGSFRYQCSTGTCQVNLLQLAAANGQVYAKDPTMAYILKKIDEAAASQGTRSPNDPLFDSYVWQSPSELFEHQPTIRIDHNVTDNHRLSGSFSVIMARRTPDYLNSADPRFPNSPNHRDFDSTRPLLSVQLRSVLSKSMTNELRGGLSAFYGGSHFGQPASVESGNSPSSFADQGGFAIIAPSTTNWYTSNTPSWRSAPTYSIDNTLTWLKHNHSMSFGGNFLVSNADSDGQQMVPSINLGFDTALDPANAMFNSTNIPGADSATLTAARNLYAVLTGRVTAISSAAVINPDTGKYEELGPTIYPGGIRQLGFFAQDSWRVTPTLTLTGGLRWDVQTPFAPSTSTMSTVTMESVCGQSGLGAGGMYSKCNFLKPGSTGGQYPEYIQLKKGTEGYKTDWNNFAPSASAAWRPDVQTGFLRTILGDPDQATLRGGYSVAYERQGLTTFTGLYGGNAGLSVPLTRNASSGLVPPGTWPVFLSEKDRLYSAPFNPDPVYPILVRSGRVDSLNAFAPDIRIAQVQNWTISFARSISKDTAVEIRYIGNVGRNQWSSLNYNSIRTENLIANGFFDEFKLAMANLAANNASGVSGRAGSFAYFGAGTGTNPLPIYLAYLNGRTDFGNPAAYTGGSSTWSSTTLAGRLAAPSPNPTSAGSDLDGTATRRTNAANAGYPANFFVLNPAVGADNVTDSGAFSDYHALQIEVRRRMSGGLSANINYQYAFKEGGSAFDGFSYGRSNTPTANVRHAIKFQADWTLPVGLGQRFGSDMNRALDMIVGGWSINVVGRAQTVLQDLGNVRLVGMTKADLQAMYKYYYRPNPTTGLTEVWMLPEDVILNTRRAFSTSTTTLDGYSASLGAPTGKYIAPANSATCIQVRPGDCAPRSTQLLAPWFFRLDIGATKRFPIRGRMNFEIRLDLLNAFDNVNFNPVSSPGTSADIFKVTSAYTDASNTYDPGGRIGQLMFRFNW